MNKICLYTFQSVVTSPKCSGHMLKNIDTKCTAKENKQQNQVCHSNSSGSKFKCKEKKILNINIRR